MGSDPQAPAPTATSDGELPGAITQSPDPKRIRDRRAKLAGRRRRLYDFLVVPAEVPSDFTEPLETLVKKLSTADATTAAAILAEAQAIFDEASNRIESAERRATTLQGTVSIAASLVIPGAGLLLDPSKISSRGWRIALIVLLGLFLASLIGSAWRALAVTGRMFEFEQAGPEHIFLRAKQPGVQAQTFRAAELLRAAGVASEVGAVKVGLLRAAAWWLRIALIVLAAFVVALGVYVVRDDSASSSTSSSATSQLTKTVSTPASHSTLVHAVTGTTR